MLSNFPIVGFIPITDAERAKRFYCDLLKLEFIEDGEFALAIRANGIIIRLFKLEEFTPSEHTVLGWEVPDIGATVDALNAAGVQMERYDFLEMDARGIWSASDRAARIAWFKDPEGNVLSLSQH